MKIALRPFAAFLCGAAAFLAIGAPCAQVAKSASLHRSVSAPVSVVFVIDNSGSMGTDLGITGNDPSRARFRIVLELLDSLSMAAPGSEAGLVVFARSLFFDDRDDAFFKPLFPGDTSQHDAYVPLIDLGRVFPDGRTGRDTLKTLLAFTDNGNLIHETTRPQTRINTSNTSANRRDGTDITLAFQAAKAAMADARNPKARQVILFLSDGEPSSVDDIRQPMMNDFMKGENCPKTLVVFFRSGTSTPVAPNSIVSMVDAIKANGYSAANPQSAFYAVNLPGTQLLALLLNGIQDGTSLHRRKQALAPAHNGYRIFSGHGSYEGFYPLITVDGRRIEDRIISR
jgi:hypothetical protein